MKTLKSGESPHYRIGKLYFQDDGIADIDLSAWRTWFMTRNGVSVGLRIAGKCFSYETFQIVDLVNALDALLAKEQEFAASFGDPWRIPKQKGKFQISLPNDFSEQANHAANNYMGRVDWNLKEFYVRSMDGSEIGMTFVAKPADEFSLEGQILVGGNGDVKWRKTRVIPNVEFYLEKKEDARRKAMNTTLYEAPKNKRS